MPPQHQRNNQKCHWPAISWQNCTVWARTVDHLPFHWRHTINLVFRRQRRPFSTQQVQFPHLRRHQYFQWIRSHRMWRPPLRPLPIYIKQRLRSQHYHHRPHHHSSIPIWMHCTHSRMFQRQCLVHNWLALSRHRIHRSVRMLWAQPIRRCHRRHQNCHRVNNRQPAQLAMPLNRSHHRVRKIRALCIDEHRMSVNNWATI